MVYLPLKTAKTRRHVAPSIKIPNQGLHRCQGRNCDFELKNGSGFYLQGFISGARFEHTTLSIKEGSSGPWRGLREWPWFGAPLKLSPRKSAIANDPFPSARSSEPYTASPAIGIYSQRDNAPALATLVLWPIQPENPAAAVW